MQITKYTPAKWNIYRDGISQSFINSFLQCKYSTYLDFVLGWTPKRTSFYFEFGSCIHYVLEKAYLEPIPPLPGTIRSYIREYESIVRKERSFNYKSYDETQMELIFGLAEVLLRSYFLYYCDDFSHNWVFTEKEFVVPKKSATGRMIPIRGRLDGGFIQGKSNLYVMDTKCLSLVDEDAIELILPLDIQCMLYFWAANELYDGERLLADNDVPWLTREVKPVGIVYNIIKRPGHKRKVNETLKDFLDRISADIITRPQDFFIRKTLQITPIELDQWVENNFTPIVQEIETWHNRGFMPRYVNPNALITKYGRSKYFNLITRNDTGMYFSRNRSFSELEIDYKPVIPDTKPLKPTQKLQFPTMVGTNKISYNSPPSDDGINW